MTTFRLYLTLGLFFSSALAQQPEVDLSSLSAEDQAVAKGLRFKAVDAAPEDTRTATFIKGRLPVINTGPQPAVVGKLNVEVRMLFRTPSKEWSVMKCRIDFVVNSKGFSEIYLSFGELNKDIERITGDKHSKVEDSITVIRYAGVKVFESEPSKATRFPVEWWLQEGKLTQRAAAAEPAKINDTSKGELKMLRVATERALRGQVWKDYEQGVAALNARYVAAIDKAMKNSQSQGLLDESLALRDEKDTVAKTGRAASAPVQVEAPALAALRATYDSALANLKTARAQASLPVMQDYNQKAEQLIARLIKDGKLDEAKSARDAKDVPLIAEE
ncbi:hypothetical protein [Prosthecobacter sp.]|uniref:hypothetical protein n=1 Tax=Prosthecobacter sp. TaxID=1965333 RepID=UPI0024882F43|nr:hypothetical protein [Prosthecobacter sp.]MDI1310891.1 hypothetical protein [Prosthecobacter sp.]